ncbi:MAG: LuxR family transcriptional regulator [Catenulispora sp.]|nr:LuxR family transcriptional regulator [Catenulispora sp.]
MTRGDQDVTLDDLAEAYAAAAEKGGEPSSADGPVIDRLVAMGLFRTAREGLVPADPETIQHESAWALVRELSEVTERYTFNLRLFARIREAVKASVVRHPAETETGLTYLHGNDTIVHAIDRCCSAAQIEVLTAQPGGGRPATTLEETVGKSLKILERGVGMRMLYQHTARYDEPTKNYVRLVSQGGATVRTLDEFFDRLIVVDRAVAFIPSNDDRSSAAMITNSTMVNFLADVYERNWVRAAQFPFEPANATRTSQDIGPSMRETLIHMLVDGLPDKQIARRLGISLRTTQGHVAAIREEFGAKNRTQLGYLIAKSQTEGTAAPKTTLWPDKPMMGSL